MATIFLLSWLTQSVTGSVAFSEEQMRTPRGPRHLVRLPRAPDFWSRTLQNWQSEFLAVASMVVLLDLPARAGIPRVQACRGISAETGSSG